MKWNIMQPMKSYWELIFNDYGACSEYNIRIHTCKQYLKYINIGFYTDMPLSLPQVFILID